MRFPSAYLCVFLFLSESCKKEEIAPAPATPPERHTEIMPGLPEDMTRVHGYFYSTHALHYNDHSQHQSFNFVNFSVHGGDLKKGLDFELDGFDQQFVVGDLAMGNLRLDTTTIMIHSLSGPRYFYNSTLNTPINNNKKRVWRYTGTQEFAADSFVFEHPYPDLLTKGGPVKLDTLSSFRIWTDTVINNYMVGSATLRGSHYRGGPYMVMNIPLNEHMRYFYMTAAQVKGYLIADGSSPPGLVRIKAYNHFHKYHRGRLYVFTFCSYVDYNVSIYQ